MLRVRLLVVSTSVVYGGVGGSVGSHAFRADVGFEALLAKFGYILRGECVIKSKKCRGRRF